MPVAATSGLDHGTPDLSPAWHPNQRPVCDHKCDHTERQVRMLLLGMGAPFVANIVTTSKALVPRSDALVPNSFLLLLVRHLFLEAMHLFLIASCYY